MSDLRDQLQKTLGDHYSLERELGGGGMSRVFVADERRLGRKVVVKVLAPELAAGLSAERFEREIRLAASLQQANIVPVLSAGDTDGLPYFTMPFVEGESLRARLAKGPLSIVEVLRILGDVSRALQYAHERGIVHRDIKPDNVLLSGGTAVVTDFGIAKAISASRTQSGSAALTQMGTSIGTPAYMSPEQAAGDPNVDHRADIYAFGCTAYELLASRPPFPGRTPARTLAAHMGEAPQPITELRPDTPAALADLVMRCLAKNPDERPQSASEVSAALEAAISGESQRTMPPVLMGGPGMLRRALIAYVAAFAVVAVLARAAITVIGLPDWVFPGALVIMALGLPMILLTAYAQRIARQVLTATPARTPGGSQTLRPQSTMETFAMKASPHLSWNRTWAGGAIAVTTFALVVGGFMLLRALGIGPAGSLLAAGKIHAREPLLVADFRSIGPDSTLGQVVSAAVRSDLGQSAAITVVPQSTMANELSLMKLPFGASVTLRVAQQMAVRQGVKAVVDGEVRALGAGYLISIQLVTADSGREIAAFRETADGPRDLINRVGDASRKLRARIGESLREIQANPPLAQATTGSIEALRKHTDAWNANGRGDYAAAVALEREAITRDTGFALAYSQLATYLNNARMPRASRDSALSHAFALRDRLATDERLSITADYYDIGPGRDRAKAIDAFQQMVDRGVFSGTNSLGNLVSSRREFARADSLARMRIKVEPTFGNTYTNLAGTLLNEGKVAAAESILTLGRVYNAPWRIAAVESRVLYEKGDIAGAEATADSVRRTSTGQPRSTMAYGLEQLALVQGSLRRANLFHMEGRTIDSARGVLPVHVSDSLAYIALHGWLFSTYAEDLRRVDAVLNSQEFNGSDPAGRPYLRVATLYAQLGRPDRARAVLSRFDAEVKDSVDRRLATAPLHETRAEIALAEKKYQEAIAEFRRADILPDGPASSCTLCLPADLARAFDAANQPDSTIAAIETYLRIPMNGRVGLDAIYLAPFLKRLGELYEARGDRAKAAASYTRFVELWKNADPELQPKVTEVKQRLARLRQAEKPG